MLFRFLILGAPASGKGTISSYILKEFNMKYIASGDKLRLHVKNGTALGIKAKKYIEEGKLVPDTLMIEFILSEIDQAKGSSWLLDGFPRTASQAEKLWAFQELDLAINLDVPFNIILDRIKGRWIHLPSGRIYNTDFNVPKVLWKDDITGEDLIQREDDKPEIMEKRLHDYEKLTTPLLNFYKNLGVLHNFRGNSSQEIWPKILKCLSLFSQKHRNARIF